MQGINSREHRVLAAAFDKFESMSKTVKNKLEEPDYSETQKAMEELDALYDRFQLLFKELDRCVKEYETKKKAVRSIINRSNRKLISELQKNNPNS